MARGYLLVTFNRQGNNRGVKGNGGNYFPFLCYWYGISEPVVLWKITQHPRLQYGDEGVLRWRQIWLCGSVVTFAACGSDHITALLTSSLSMVSKELLQADVGKWVL
jgi:hypothetical protein